MENIVSNKVKKHIKNSARVDAVCSVLEITPKELTGLLTLMNIDEEIYSISIDAEGNPIIIKSTNYKRTVKAKENMDQLICTKLCVVSDTHLCSEEQQLSLLNEIYLECHKKEIDTVLHIGDVVDGDYQNVRNEHRYAIFAHGYTRQKNYVVDMYPHVEGLTTYFITGSHDATHFKNGGAILGEDIAKERDDMVYLGQGEAIFVKNNIKMLLKHPGGGNAKVISNKAQNIVDSLETGNKPGIAFIGHYHKSYYMLYRNVHTFLVPCIVGKTQFMKDNSLDNIVGAYFIDLYTTKKGEIQYLDFEEYRFDAKDYNPNDYIKCKKLTI